MSDAGTRYGRFVAIGDSFPEGVGDPDTVRPNGVRGWADRVAEVLSGARLGAGRSPLQYANLAVRGKLLDQVLDDQVQPAVELQPDLLAICAGANDLLRPGVDIDGLIGRYDAALSRLAGTGARVVTFTGFDTGSRPLFAALRGRFAIYNELLRESVERHGLTLVDFWRYREFADRRMWDFDRMHLSTAGHRQMAHRVLEALDVTHDLDPVELGPHRPLAGLDEWKDNGQWVLQAAGPWIGRRIRGVSRGDTTAPRFPELVDVQPDR
ncbi:SGNH/GDSL hydrolase family protein [Williamsia sp. CHRR-6]|uniref:SGNH/GDSL hydrolase family protein n=1 Tax=Williamsia sp. CHRR-6 TaxID=2835871 RepID=UPI001BDA7EA7|nr:SGNH/GDSL hydrolase family protein [Williamsia sp. CHRR-6]MBT0568472.1 SGNH/GDSL hydrolase family protein [Williamsia sp. CHRR-6]